MSNCLQNIIGVKNPCDANNTESLSGWFINDYPGITLQSAANVADEKTLTGYNYLVDLVRRAMLRLNNDLLSYINREYKVNSILNSSWQTGSYTEPYSTIAAGDPSIQRGLYFTKKKTECQLTKLFISKIRIFSDYTGTTTLKVMDVDANVSYTPTISLVAGEIKEFVLNIALQGEECRITLPGDIVVYHNKPNCGRGCDGGVISDCVNVYGLNDNVSNTSECYGIEVEVLCKCDLSNLICEMISDKLLGQAAFELCGAMFYDEMTKTNRLNYLTIYKGEEIKAQAAAGFDSYRNYMESMFSGLRSYLVSKDGGCGCIDCGGIQIKTNV